LETGCHLTFPDATGAAGAGDASGTDATAAGLAAGSSTFAAGASAGLAAASAARSNTRFRLLSLEKIW
jgi:hypothetical protein